MSADRRSRVRPHRPLARLAAVALLALLGVAGLAQLAGNTSQPPRATEAAGGLIIQIRGGGRILQRLDVSAALSDGRVDPAGLRRIVRARLVRRWLVTRGSAQIDYRITPGAVVRRANLDDGPLVRVAAFPRASVIRAPRVAQALRNNCETAALEVLLATVGRRSPQLALQAALRTSGPLDPIDGPRGRIWGDPDFGYVGRPGGGGVAGGFGVYEGPIRDLAAQRGVELQDLTGRRLADLLGRVRAGRAVMVWVGLSDGPYRRWRSPEGRGIRVNLGEHAVVLTGVDPEGRVSIVNVLEGTTEVWTQTKLLAMWELLDRRALAAPAPS